MPRVLHVIDDLLPGGATTQLRLLAEHHEAHVATRRWAGEAAAPLAGTTWLGGRFSFDPFAVVRLRRLIREQVPAVLQSWDDPSARLCRAASQRGGPRWVHTARGGANDDRWAALAGGVITSDETTAGRLAAEGIASRLVVNAYAPGLIASQLPPPCEARHRLRTAGVDVADDAAVIVTVARLDDIAGLKELAWAADLVRAVRPGLRLLVVGEGPARVAGQRFAGRACEPGLVNWLGAWRDLRDVYAAADVVWCGRGGGAMPTPAVEAWAAGKPTVLAEGTDRVSLPRDGLPYDGGLPPRVLAWDDRAGWARTTKRLLERPELATELGKQAAEQARASHDASRVAAGYNEAIAALASA